MIDRPGRSGCTQSKFLSKTSGNYSERQVNCRRYKKGAPRTPLSSANRDTGLLPRPYSTTLSSNDHPQYDPPFWILKPQYLFIFIEYIPLCLSLMISTTFRSAPSIIPALSLVPTIPPDRGGHTPKGSGIGSWHEPIQKCLYLVFFGSDA